MNPFALSDRTLVTRALSGSQRAWTRLVRRYEHEIFNHAFRMTGSHADAHDLCQDIFLAVFRNLPSFRGEAKFRTWLYRIASNRSIDLLRKRKNMCSLEDIGHHAALTDPGEVQQFHDNRQILALLRLLSADQRLVIELKFYQQFTFAEIGTHMNSSSSTAKTRFYTALGKLRSSMEAEHDTAEYL